MRQPVYITRAGHWSFEFRERQPISESEWHAYADGDGELRPLHSLPCFERHTGKLIGTTSVEKTWEWIAHPRGRDPMRLHTFEYNRGGIIVRAPDSELLRKALEVARTLGARVLSDDNCSVSILSKFGACSVARSSAAV